MTTTRAEFQPQLARELSSITTLQQLLEWAKSRNPPITIDNFVTLDEYTHEAIARWGEHHYLVFGLT